MKLVAIKSFTYAGKRVNAGDIFDVKTDREAKILVGIRSARFTESRPEAKIPPPEKILVDQASSKPDSISPEVKEEVKAPEVEEEETPEPKSEAAKEEGKEEIKPADSTKPNVNSGKRSYNKRK